MKKAKVMLTGIVILAIVGGALAFKAKTTFNDIFCVRLTSSGTGACTAAFTGKASTSGTVYYTAAFATDCSKQNCSTPAITLNIEP